MAEIRCVEVGRKDIELWEGQIMHGCWSPGVVAADPDFWLRVGIWLTHGTAKDLNVLKAGTWGEHRDSLTEAKYHLVEALDALNRLAAGKEG